VEVEQNLWKIRDKKPVKYTNHILTFFVVGVESFKRTFPIEPPEHVSRVVKTADNLGKSFTVTAV
jgi:hypothetical protein